MNSLKAPQFTPPKRTYANKFQLGLNTVINCECTELPECLRQKQFARISLKLSPPPYTYIVAFYLAYKSATMLFCKTSLSLNSTGYTFSINFNITSLEAILQLLGQYIYESFLLLCPLKPTSLVASITYICMKPFYIAKHMIYSNIIWFLCHCILFTLWVLLIHPWISVTLCLT